ncbi:MAG: DUF3834 domain-containing protein [Fusobacteriaceae bacterium]|nr:DUF3834 domain-containing protein [Fusobacteriaceae bacterium]
MKKNFFLVFIFLISIPSFSLDIYLPKAPPSLPLAKAGETIKELNLKYYNDVTTEVVPAIVKNEEALFVLPVNTAAQLYNKGKNLKLIAILSEGLLSVVSSDNIKKFSDLNKKDVYIGGQGSSPDVIASYLFKKNNIKPNIKYRSSTEIAKLIMSGKIDTAILPEPQASMVLDKNKDLKRIIILKDEWKKITGQNSIPQVGLFALNKTIVDKNNLINTLGTQYKKSLIWIENNKALAAKFGIDVFQVTLSQEAFENSINNMNLVYIESFSSKNTVDTYLKALNSIDNTIINKIPGDDFYKK